MIVMHVIAARGVGGSERMLAQLVAAPRKQPLAQIVVNLLADNSLAAAVRAAGAEYRELGLSSAVQAPRCVWALRRLLRERRPDVVQSWLYYADLIALAALELSGRRRETQLYWGIRCSELDFSRYSPLLRRAFRGCVRLSHRPDGVVANSFAGLNAHLRAGYAPRRSGVILNGIDTARFSPDATARTRVRAELGIGTDEDVVIHAARVDPMKSHDSALQVAAMQPQAKFVFAGEGTERLRLPANALALGLRHDMPALYAAADVVLSSSSFGEGFPNIVGEAMACGVPAVATEVGDARRLVGDTGLIVAPGDVAGMSDSIRTLLGETKEARCERARLARGRIERDFSLDRAVAMFDALHLSGVWPVTAGP